MEQTESNKIKLVKNSKGYNWEITIKQNNEFQDMDAVVAEINRLDLILNKSKGGK